MKILYITWIMTWFFAMIGLSQESVIVDLEDQIIQLEEGEKVIMKYNFVGCFGPYQKGSFEFTLQEDTIQYLSKSFDNKSGQSINQAGQYDRAHLLQLLEDAKGKKSSEILGNSIHYEFKLSEQGTKTGTDYIDQRHFIQLFHPFTSFLNSDEKMPFGLKKKTIKGING